MTATRITPSWLYIRQPLALTFTATAGLTITVKICATDEGNPSAIGSLTATASESTGTYTHTFSSSALVTALASAYVNKPVYVFVTTSDGAVFEVFPFVVTDIDPDLQPTSPRPIRDRATR